MQTSPCPRCFSSYARGPYRDPVPETVLAPAADLGHVPIPGHGPKSGRPFAPDSLALALAVAGSFVNVFV